MARTRLAGALVVVTIMAMAGCAPASAPAGRRDAEPPQGGGPVPSRTLVIMARGEPINLGAVKMQAAGPAGREVARLFFATLDFADEHGMARSYLAEALPQLNMESWRVFPDGRMETTHRLKPNLTWHDGAPLSADDFVFAWRVFSTPAVGVAASPPIKQMEDVVAPDPRSVVIRWREPYPEAGQLLEGFEALPRHLLERSFQEETMEVFASQAYWTQAYVGLGPYRLDRWEPGTWIEGAAFDVHALGRARIERVRVMVGTDPNAALAALLSGDAHIIMDNIVRLQDGPQVKSHGAVVHASPLSFRQTQFQLRPEMGGLPELRDVRVRAAIAHAIDKHGMNDGVWDGQAVVADSYVSPLVDYYPLVERAIIRYGYDLRRAQQLLEEAGLRKGSDGFYANLTAAPLLLEVRTTASPWTEAENTILVEGFRRLGLNAQTYVLPVVMMRDNQAVTTFPALFPTGGGGHERGLSDYATASIPRAENRWLGRNRGGWSNPTYDRLWDAFNSTLDRVERNQQVAQMEKLLSEQVATVPHYYTPRLLVHVPTLRGPVGRSADEAMELVHVHTWEWTDGAR